MTGGELFGAPRRHGTSVMSDTAFLAERYERLSEKWRLRLDQVEERGERTLYVTRDEFDELRQVEALAKVLEPPAVTAQRELQAGLMGAIGNLFATPVVIDEEKARAQLG